MAWLEPAPSDGTTASALERPSQRPIDVEAEWLDASPEPAASSEAGLASPRKRPPRLPGATRTLPPMPIVSMTQRPPPRRHATMEVDMSWLELVEEKTRKTGDDGASKGAPAATARATTRSSAPPSSSAEKAAARSPSRGSRPPTSEKAGISNARTRKPIRREED